MDKFAQAGYGSRDIGFGERPALVMVDFQKGFTDASNPLGRSDHVQRAVDNTATLLAACKAKGIPAASCAVSWGGPDEMTYWKIDTLFDGSFYHGHPCTELDPRIRDDGYVFQFIKTAPSIFYETPLKPWLVKHCIDTTIITGCTTSGCVRASIVDSFSHGFRTMVPEDCVGDHDAGPHHANLEDCGRRYADIVMADDCIAYIEDWRKRNG